MATINLRDFYPWYTWDEFVEVPDVIAVELFADRKYQQAHERKMRFNKVLSLDAEDGTEELASALSTNSPEALFEIMELRCRLCHALNSLPEEQGQRIEAHFILGKSKAVIAHDAGVDEKNVRQSIKRGLRNMKNYLEKI